MNLIYIRKVGYGVRRIEDLGMGSPVNSLSERNGILADDESSLSKLQKLLEDALASIN